MSVSVRSGACPSRTCSVHVYANEHMHTWDTLGILPVYIHPIPRKDRGCRVSGLTPPRWAAVGHPTKTCTFPLLSAHFKPLPTYLEVNKRDPPGTPGQCHPKTSPPPPPLWCQAAPRAPRESCLFPRKQVGKASLHPPAVSVGDPWGTLCRVANEPKASSVSHVSINHLLRYHIRWSAVQASRTWIYNEA